jgi:hypothetical protein
MKIVARDANYFLDGASRGFRLTIDCLEQLTRYNVHTLLDVDYDLLTSFSAATDVQSFAPAIDLLIRRYQLHRRPAFNGEAFAPILSRRIEEIRDLPEATDQSIGQLTDEFQELQRSFTDELGRNSPLPDVTLSKLLHFVKPNSFWILDSRVKTILDIWGYPKSFSGFGKFLTDLFHDRSFSEFKTFIQNKNIEQVANHRIHNLNCSFLKLLDKLLWFTRIQSATGTA